MLAGNLHSRYWRAIFASEPAEPAKIEPSGGLEALDQFLGRRREDEANETRVKEDNRNALFAACVQVEPIVMQAIDLTNAKLAQHSKMQLLEETKPAFAHGQIGAKGELEAVADRGYFSDNHLA